MRDNSLFIQIVFLELIDSKRLNRYNDNSVYVWDALQYD